MHTRRDLLRAVMEGVIYSQRQNLDILRGMNVVPETMLACGGGAKSPCWRQMMARDKRSLSGKADGAEPCCTDFGMMIVDIERMTRLIPKPPTGRFCQFFRQCWQEVIHQHCKDLAPDVKIALLAADIVQQGTTEKH